MLSPPKNKWLAVTLRFYAASSLSIVVFWFIRARWPLAVGSACWLLCLTFHSIPFLLKTLVACTSQKNTARMIDYTSFNVIDSTQARAGASPARTLYGFDRYFVAGYGRGLPPPWLLLCHTYAPAPTCPVYVPQCRAAAPCAAPV